MDMESPFSSMSFRRIHRKFASSLRCIRDDRRGFDVALPPSRVARGGFGNVERSRADVSSTVRARSSSGLWQPSDVQSFYERAFAELGVRIGGDRVRASPAPPRASVSAATLGYNIRLRLPDGGRSDGRDHAQRDLRGRG